MIKPKTTRMRGGGRSHTKHETKQRWPGQYIGRASASTTTPSKRRDKVDDRAAQLHTRKRGASGLVPCHKGGSEKGEARESRREFKRVEESSRERESVQEREREPHTQHTHTQGHVHARKQRPIQRQGWLSGRSGLGTGNQGRRGQSSRQRQGQTRSQTGLEGMCTCWTHHTRNQVRRG